MASVIPYTKDKPGRRGEQTADGKAFSDLSFEDKLSTLYREYRCEDKSGRIMLNRTWFASSLYYQGKQRVEWNPETSSLEWYDTLPGEDFYVENQYRKDVNANVATLCRNEMKPEPRPSSEKPEDVAAANKANSALHVINDDVKEDRLTVRKNLYLCLYGNAFRYNGFGYDPAHGKTMIPKFAYEDVPVPGVMACPCGNTAATETGDPMNCESCGSPMEVMTPPDTVTSKMEAGYEERLNGRNCAFITGPLEMYARSKCDVIDHQPYLFWVRRLDTDIIQHYRPKAKTDVGTVTGGADDDLGQYYMDVLSTLAGGPLDGMTSSSDMRYYRESEYAMCWVRPEAFKGDKELLKKFPNGVQFETCNGQYIPDTADNRSMDACWTHYVYLLNPYSFWGDGMVDALPIQDQINETGSLLVRHLRFSTVGKNIFDQNVITPAWISNNPEESWIPGNPQIEKSIKESVFQIQPVPLSNNVPQWRQDQRQAMRDMTKAYDPFNRGANTPYSADVFQAEQAMGQFAPTIKYNRASVITCTYQSLALFRDNVTEEREYKFRDNTGRWSYDKFTGATLATGSFDIYIAEAEYAPRSKAEKIRGLELLTNLVPILPMLSQKQKVYVYDVIGLPADANPDTLVSQKAYRDIDAIVKRGDDVQPNPFIIGNMPVYVKTIQEFLLGEEGDDLAAQQPELFVKVSDLMMTALMMAQQVAMMPPMGAVGGPGGPPPAGTPQPNSGSPKKPPEQEQAQAPVPDEQKVGMPELPAGARQG